MSGTRSDACLRDTEASGEESRPLIQSHGRARAGRLSPPLRCVLDTSAALARSLRPLPRRSAAKRSSIVPMEMRSYLLPRNGLDPTCTVVGHSTFDLTRPGIVNVCVASIFDTLEKKTGELRTILHRKCRCPLIQFMNGLVRGCHPCDLTRHRQGRRLDGFCLVWERVPPHGDRFSWSRFPRLSGWESGWRMALHWATFQSVR
jgi:hypothetical protein